MHIGLLNKKYSAVDVAWTKKKYKTFEQSVRAQGQYYMNSTALVVKIILKNV